MQIRRGAADSPALLRPGYLAALAGVLALVVGALAWYGLHESQRAALERLETDARALAEAVARAGENALRADAEIELLVVERLLDNARLVADEETYRPLADTLLARIAERNGLYEVSAVDAAGELEASSSGLAPEAAAAEEEWYGPLLDLLTDDEEVAFGFDADQRYAVALRRPAGGAVLVRADAAWMLELRRASGTGRLIQELGANPGIAYMVLQDTIGILSASQGVEQMERIAGDPFLEAALAGDGPASRRIAYGDGELFETVLPFGETDPPIGLLRIGLRIDDLQAAERRALLQLGLLAGLLAVLGAVGAGVLTARQNYALLNEAYRRIQTYSSRVLAHMADAMIATDTAGRIEVFNEAAAELFGVDPAAAHGQPYDAVLGTALEPVRRLLEEGVETQGETLELRTADGRRLTLSVSASMVSTTTAGDAALAQTAVILLRDLTEKTALETGLRRQERLVSMGSLAAGVAHEVRNPLNAISIIVQRLKREFAPAAAAEAYEQLIGTVRDEVARVNRIVVDFLELARPPQLRLRPVELEPLLEHSLNVAAPQAMAKGLDIRGDFAGVGTIMADPEQLQQALLNLLQNAIEATETGHISLEGRLLGDDRVELAVADTGSGIAPEDLERIFDLYFTTKPSGTGLGLGLVHRIATEHGGRVEAQSRPGQGTRLALILPRGPLKTYVQPDDQQTPTTDTA